MGRTMPVDCVHGVTIDWGDFGPCNGHCDDHPGEPCPDFPGCEQCDRTNPRTSSRKARKWRARAERAEASESRLLAEVERLRGELEDRRG